MKEEAEENQIRKKKEREKITRVKKIQRRKF